ncbi:MAG: hypothetical protein ACOCV4_05270 [Myxococcota bacterium]
MEVLPAAPDSLAVALDPRKDVYVIDDRVTLVAQVQDTYGNDVPDAEVTYVA